MKDNNQAAYLAYDKFETFKRPIGMSMIDFINEFERLYNNIKKYEMELSAEVSAYRLLKGAEISEDKQQLARATLTSFSYEWMKRQLKTIYDNLSQETSSLPLKVEPAFESKWYRKDGYYSSGANNSFTGGRGRSTTARGESQQNMDWRNQCSDLRRKNPMYIEMERYADVLCQSIYHYARDCWHSDFNKSQENKVTLFSQEAQKVSYKIF